MSGEALRGQLEEAIRERAPIGEVASQERLEICGGVLRTALLGAERAGDSGLLWLRGAKIRDVLDLQGLELRTRLKLHGCEFDEEVRIGQMEASDVELLDCRVPKGLAATQAEIRWNLKLDRSELGPVDLRGARIGGRLSLEETTLEESGESGDENPPALDMETAEVAGGVYCNKLNVRGEIQMAGAKIGHRLSLNGAKLKVQEGTERSALKADGVEVSGNLICHDAEIDGAFRLGRADIHGQLSLSNSSLTGELNTLGATVRREFGLLGAKIVNPAGRTIKGDRMQVGGGIHGTKFESTGLVRMVGAQIGDQLGLEKAVLMGGLMLTGATVEGIVDLEEAQIAGPPGGWAINADGVQARGGLYAHGLQASGEVRLVGGKIDGATSFAGATLLNDEGLSLNAEGVEAGGLFACSRGFAATGGLRLSGASVSGSLVLDEAEVIGGVTLTGASVKFDLSFDGAFLRNEKGPALTADRIAVGGTVGGSNGFHTNGEVRVAGSQLGSISLNGANMSGAEEEGTGVALNAEGAVVADSINLEGAGLSGALRLSGSRLGSQLVLIGANLNCKTEPALSADRLTAQNGVYCISGFRARGEVSFYGAQIGGQMCLNGAVLHAATATDMALNLVSSEIDELALGTEEVVGICDLRQAKVRSLLDASEGRMGATRVSEFRLDGFSYEWLREPLNAKDRLAWLANSQKRSYVPGAYVELANAFRRVGRHGDARKVAIAGERRARQDLKKWSPRGILQDLLWVTVGYGYANWLALFWLIAVIALGATVLCLGEGSFIELQHPSPAFNPVLYAIDATVPVLELGQQSTWAPKGAMAWVSLFLSASGWALATAVIAAAAGLLGRDQR